MRSRHLLPLGSVRRLRRPLVLASLLGALAAPARAWVLDPCPPGTAPTEFDLISGRLPMRGQKWMRDRLEAIRQQYLRDLDEARARRESAPWRIALGENEEAIRELELSLTSRPADYETLAYLAMARGRLGQFVEAKKLAEQAMTARPADAADPGPDYLAVLRYRERMLAPGGMPPLTDYLDRAYADFPRKAFEGGSALGALAGAERDPVRARQIAVERIAALLHREPELPDAYLVLGDVLHEAGDPSLAVAAWERARVLGHPAPGALDRRLDQAHATFAREARLKASFPPTRAEGREATARSLEAEFEAARQWRAKFEEVHGIVAATSPDPTFADCEALLADRGFFREEGRSFGLARDLRAFFTTLPGIGSIGLLGVGLWFLLRSRTPPEKAAPARRR